MFGRSISAHSKPLETSDEMLSVKSSRRVLFDQFATGLCFRPSLYRMMSMYSNVVLNLIPAVSLGRINPVGNFIV